MPAKKRTDVVKTDIAFDNSISSDDDSERELTTIMKCTVQDNASQSSIKLNDFLKNPKFLRPSGDETTNIVDCMKSICYCIPEEKIDSLFKRLEDCRRSNATMKFYEKQGDYSGIMLDFDIYQDTKDNTITPYILQQFCTELIKLLLTILNMPSRLEVIIGVTMKEKTVYNEEKKCWKNGFHLIIPSIMIQRPIKRYIIDTLIKRDILCRVFDAIEPSKQDIINGRDYTRSDFLDVNSAHVPVFFIGSSTKSGTRPYLLKFVFRATIDNSKLALIKEDVDFVDESVNIIGEFSVNWSVHNGIIKKDRFDPIDSKIGEIKSVPDKQMLMDDSNRTSGLLSLNSINDPQVSEIKNLLDILKPERADNYDSWYKILCILANTSPMYINLARYFSEKSKKYDEVSFERVWSSIIASSSQRKNNMTLGTLHYMAKEDDEVKYKCYRKNTVFKILYDKVFTLYREGKLSHSDVAETLYKLLPHKYIADRSDEGKKGIFWYEFIVDEDDQREGEIYKWRITAESPISINRYMSDVMPNLFSMISANIKKLYDDAVGVKNSGLAKYYFSILKGFHSTMRDLGNNNFKKNVMAIATDYFYKIGFSEKVDKEPLVRGVKNGVLKLSSNQEGPNIIKGYHPYAVSRFMPSSYNGFNPYDPETKKVIMIIRSLFPDTDSDAHEFTTIYLSSTIDGNPKDPMLVILIGTGSNGKTMLIELHRNTLGEYFCVKLALDVITGKNKSSENATPSIMKLKHATMVTYSESEQNQTLNTAKVKELMGGETIAGRALFSELVNFKPVCHHLVTTNYEFTIDYSDDGIWRRIFIIKFKMVFNKESSEKYDKNNVNHRIRDESLANTWNNNEKTRDAYLSYLVWLNYKFYNTYGGKLSNIYTPHMDIEKQRYKIRQDSISAFLAIRLVKLANPKEETALDICINSYIKWYESKYGKCMKDNRAITENLNNSSLGAYINSTKKGYFIRGHRIKTENDEELFLGEEMAVKDIYDYEIKEDTSGVVAESPEEYWMRICREYDEIKDKFSAHERLYHDNKQSVIKQAPVDQVFHNTFIKKPLNDPVEFKMMKKNDTSKITVEDIMESPFDNVFIEEDSDDIVVAYKKEELSDDEIMKRIKKSKTVVNDEEDESADDADADENEDDNEFEDDSDDDNDDNENDY